MNGQNRNTFTEHPLIAREQTFCLDRKLVTIHSEDRDIIKYPNSNYKFIYSFFILYANLVIYLFIIHSIYKFSDMSVAVRLNL